VADKIGFGMTSILYGILGGVVILYMALTSKERPQQEDEQKPELLASLKALATNPKFWIAGFSNAFYSAAMSLVMVGLPFYAQYTLGISSGQTSLLFAVVLLIAIASVAVWAFFVRRFGVMRVWRAALAFLAVAYIPLFFANSFITAMAAAAVVGFGFAGVITTMDLVQAKVMDEDTAKYNVRREGIISNALGFMNRLSGFFTGLAFSLLFTLFAFESGTNPGPQPDVASKYLLTVFPFVCMLLSLGFSFLLHFDESKPRDDWDGGDEDLERIDYEGLPPVTSPFPHLPEED
jgi:GPH family glycoside/pentoside/hexuronide:cation symporter